MDLPQKPSGDKVCPDTSIVAHFFSKVKRFPGERGLLTCRRGLVDGRCLGKKRLAREGKCGRMEAERLSGNRPRAGKRKSFDVLGLRWLWPRRARDMMGWGLSRIARESA